jgi:murein DD-endopeptidase MepM/ murein hydrolase activator NlpD
MSDEESIKFTYRDHTANRILLKRLQNRRKKIDKTRDMTIIIMLVIVFGMTAYAVMEYKTSFNTSANTAKLNTIKIDPGTKRIYNCFSTVGTSSLEVSLPGKIGSVIGVGFHQADNRLAVAMQPVESCLDRESTATVSGAIQKTKRPVLFVMESRGRGNSLTTAADVAMKVGSDVYSPVDGVVRKVKTYNLYGKLMDNHVEIEPDGYPDLRVAIIHIMDVRVNEGDRVKRLSTRIATMRPLPQIQSQVNRYLPEAADHVHVQINPATVEEKMKS